MQIVKQSESDLKSVLCVLDKVNSEVEVDGRRNVRREGGQSKDLDGSTGRSSRFSGQSVPGQVVGHYMAFTGIHLNVHRRVDRLASKLAHRLLTIPTWTRRMMSYSLRVRAIIRGM